MPVTKKFYFEIFLEILRLIIQNIKNIEDMFPPYL